MDNYRHTQDINFRKLGKGGPRNVSVTFNAPPIMRQALADTMELINRDPKMRDHIRCSVSDIIKIGIFDALRKFASYKNLSRNPVDFLLEQRAKYTDDVNFLEEYLKMIQPQLESPETKN